VGLKTDKLSNQSIDVVRDGAQQSNNQKVLARIVEKEICLKRPFQTNLNLIFASLIFLRIPVRTFLCLRIFGLSFRFHKKTFPNTCYTLLLPTLKKVL
jgi:hypothetical protein